MDRLGRSQVEVINRLNDLQQQGIHVGTLDGLIDTKALGKMAPLVVGLLTGLSEVEVPYPGTQSRGSVEHRRDGRRPGWQTQDFRQEGVAGAAFKAGGRVLQVIKEQTGLALGHHQNRQRAGSDGVTKVLAVLLLLIPAPVMSCTWRWEITMYSGGKTWRRRLSLATVKTQESAGQEIPMQKLPEILRLVSGDNNTPT